MESFETVKDFWDWLTPDSPENIADKGLIDGAPEKAVKAYNDYIKQMKEDESGENGRPIIV